MASLTAKVFDQVLPVVGGLDRVLPNRCRMTRLPFSGHCNRVRAHASGLHRHRSGVREPKLLTSTRVHYR